MLACCTTTVAHATDWELFKQQSDPALYVKSYSGVLLDGHKSHGEPFDLWLVNSGYQYPVVDDVSLFMEAGPVVISRSRQSGFNMSSGLRYRISPEVNIGSQVTYFDLNRASARLEINSSLLLAPSLSLIANYGVSAMTAEHALTLGVGFHF